jgi:hypothetical protein
MEKPSAIFKDNTLDSELYGKGYFVNDLLTTEQVQQCLALYREVNSEMNDKFYNTLASPNLNYRKLVQNRLEEVLGDWVRARFNNYKVLAYNFAAKGTGEGSSCNIHNDDWHADEDVYTCINVWIPLVDVNAENGSLYVLPNSHHLPYPIRGIGLPFAYEHYMHLIEPRLKVMEMKAGQGLFFHSRIIHGSYDNKTSADRPAIILAMLPEPARPEVFLKHPQLKEDEVELFNAPTDFYLQADILKKPVEFESLGIYKYAPVNISEREFLSIIEPADGGKNTGILQKLKSILKV